MSKTLLLPVCTVALLAICVPHSACAQHAEEAAEEGAHHEVSLLLAHTHLSSGVAADGSHKWVVLPSWGINYNYWINPHWAVGLHTDIITESFVVKSDLHGGEEEVTERSHPVAPAIMATFRPHHHLAFILGAGEELAKEGNLFLVRAGAEYSIHISGPWETSGSLAYDFRFNAYDSWTLAFGIARGF